MLKHWGVSLLTAVFLLAAPVVAHAHGGETDGGSSGGLLLVLATLLTGGILYTRGVWQVWVQLGRGRVIAPWRLAAFWVAMAALLVALASPLERWSGELFAAHMVQHVLLLLVAAPLLVLGLPPAALAWLLPHRWRRPFAQRFHPLSQRLQRGLGWPLFVWLLYGLALWVWHLPLLYEAAVNNEWIHGLEHASFVGTAVLFWWTLAYSRGRHFYSAALLFVFTTALHSGLLGVLLTFARRPFYPVYAAPRPTFPWQIDVLADQQLAGAIMWSLGSLAYLIALLSLLSVSLNLFEQGNSRRKEM